MVTDGLEQHGEGLEDEENRHHVMNVVHLPFDFRDYATARHEQHWQLERSRAQDTVKMNVLITLMTVTRPACQDSPVQWCTDFYKAQGLHNPYNALL